MSRLKRPRQPMPADVDEALRSGGALGAYRIQLMLYYHVSTTTGGSSTMVARDGVRSEKSEGVSG